MTTMTTNSFFVPQGTSLGEPTAAEFAGGLRDALAIASVHYGFTGQSSFDTFNGAFVSGDPSVQRKVFKVTVELVDG